MRRLFEYRHDIPFPTLLLPSINNTSPSPSPFSTEKEENNSNELIFCVKEKRCNISIYSICDHNIRQMDIDMTYMN